MYELISVTGRSFYIQCPARIGVVKLSDTDVCLIDSGSDKDAGRKVRQILDKNGWHLTAIYCTHSHADHIGGCKYLQAQTGCKVYAPGIELDFTRHPVLEPSLLYGGYPFQELRNKFLMAQGSDAEELTPDVLPGYAAAQETPQAAPVCAGSRSGPQAAEIRCLEIIPLPGHAFEMVGFRTADDVVYLADCLSGRGTLDKYKIGYLYDIGAYLETLEMVKTMNARMFVPAHAEAAEDIAPLAQYNIDRTLEVAEKIVEICAEPLCFEAVLKRLFDDYGLTMNYQQYVLVGSTVRSYLAWLKDTGRVAPRIEDNLLLWERVS